MSRFNMSKNFCLFSSCVMSLCFSFGALQADPVQDRTDAQKREAEHLEDERQSQQRVEDKIQGQKLQDQKIEEQRLQRKREDEARWRKKLDDERWDRQHRLV